MLANPFLNDTVFKAVGPMNVGDPLKGVNLMKTGDDPKVMKDEEYPSWLFELIEERPSLAVIFLTCLQSLHLPSLSVLTSRFPGSERR